LTIIPARFCLPIVPVRLRYPSACVYNQKMRR
jgi:hypothetical protein